MKNKKKVSRKRNKKQKKHVSNLTKQGEEFHVRRLYTIPPGRAEEFARVCKDRKLSMSHIVSSLIHEWLVQHGNGTEALEEGV